MADFIFWYLILLLVGGAALPLAQRFLSNLPDRGYTLTKPLGLLLWGFIFWLLTSLGLVQNNLGGVLFALLLVAGLGFWSAGGWKGYKQSFKFIKEHSRLVLTSEALFLLAFILWAVMRAANPQVSGTEKPMEMAFINAILRSPSFPPQDPWLSGYAISYYYFGYVMAAMLIRLTGVTSGVGFNLAVASWFALVAVASYGVVFNLLSVANRPGKANGKALFTPHWQALIAPVFVLIVSNLGGLLEVLHASGQFWQKSASGWTSDFWKWLAMPELVNPPAEPLGWVPERVSGIWWWRASRVVQDFDIAGGWREVIDEFPFFTYYLADLHPHLLSMPFVLLAVGLALNLFLLGEKVSFRILRLRHWVRKLDFWWAALVFGGLSFLNTWDFPIYLALFSAVYTLVRFRQEGWAFWLRAQDLAGTALALGAAGIALYLPFYVGFSSQAGGVLPSLSFFTRGIYFWIMFAPLLTPIFLWLAWRWLQNRNWSHFWKGLQMGLLVLALLWVFSYLLGGLAVVLPGLGQSLLSSNSEGIVRLGQNLIEWGGLFLNLQGSSDGAAILTGSLQARLADPGTWLSLVLLIALTWGWLAASVHREPVGNNEKAAEGEAEAQVMPTGSPDTFVLLLVLVGAALTLAVEFVYLRDQFGMRMNTIFKFYFQSWMVWALAASYGSLVVWRAVSSAWRWLARGIWLVVVACGLIYPFFGFSSTLDFKNTETWTLDGNAWFSVYYAEEQAAVDWLETAPHGVIAEAVGGSYTSAARFATYTGLPNVLGWPGHESQWRGGSKEMGTRQDDLARLYRTTNWDEAQAILEQYAIRYVIIGGLERSTYKVSEAKFQSHLNKAFEAGSVVIYEVQP